MPAINVNAAQIKAAKIGVFKGPSSDIATAANNGNSGAVFFT
jgi:hypothetical protein